MASNAAARKTSSAKSCTHASQIKKALEYETPDMAKSSLKNVAAEQWACLIEQLDVAKMTQQLALIHIMSSERFYCTLQ